MGMAETQEKYREALAELVPWGKNGAFSRPRRPLTRSEMLLELRSILEHHHLLRLKQDIRATSFIPLVLDGEPNFPVDLSKSQLCCNKSTMVYTFRRNGSLLDWLHDYLYDAWLRPYRNVVEYGDFIASVTLVVRPLTEHGTWTRVIEHGQPPEAVADALRRMAKVHIHMGNEAERSLSRASELLEQYRNGIPMDDVAGTLDEEQEAQKHYILRPLFRALIIVVVEHDVEDRLKNYRDDIGKAPVYLVRTGHDAGLSAPITFEPLSSGGELLPGVAPYEGPDTMFVHTTLRAAVKFVQDLDEREQAALGRREDQAIESPRALELVRNHAKRWGWEGIEVAGPSSIWVDTTEFPKWMGSGAALVAFQDRTRVRQNLDSFEEAYREKWEREAKEAKEEKERLEKQRGDAREKELAGSR